MRALELEQRWPAPRAPRPIVLIGAGGIANDAHLPAYRALGLEVRGCYDVDAARARATARRFEIARTYPDLAAACAEPGAVFDLALPPAAVAGVLAVLPRGAGVLIQKPFGMDLGAAGRLRELCRERALVAAVNFQLRYAPNMLALRALVERGDLGRIVEADVRVNCKMPWELWPFLRGLPRMELVLHSIHYLDLLRALLGAQHGEPRAVWARTVRHPDAPQLASSRSSAILDFGDDVRCCLSIHHHHAHGPAHEASELRIEGTRGAAIARMGVNLDYPRGRPDALEVALDGQGWREVPLAGSWFPDAFRGPMSNLQRFLAGDDAQLWTAVDDAWRTMALVEACYASDASGGTPLPADAAQPSDARGGRA
ncbi:MAG: Gfo/Idh/MocA family oxidoreductase [Planctomycetota bacterium]|nr:MAG: Gfo/Idh/MocA family oxidoreductase [Planctomycetota bacterium]